MKKILARSKKYGNHYVIIDESDYDHLKTFSWTVYKDGKRLYVCTKMNGKKVKMHRYLLGLTDPNISADHINRNGMDNRRANLRPATKSQNGMNRERQLKKKYKYKGVYWHKNRNKYMASIIFEGKCYYLGYFKKAKDAAKAYNDAAQKYYKEFAVLNKI